MFSEFQYFHNYYSSSFDFIFFVIFRTALVNIVLILAPWTAKGGVGPAAQEHLLAVLAQAQGLVTVYQHEAEHHLDTQQQGVNIPINSGLIQQLNVVAGSDPTERSHGLAVQPPCVLVDGIIIIVVQNGGGQGNDTNMNIFKSN